MAILCRAAKNSLGGTIAYSVDVEYFLPHTQYVQFLWNFFISKEAVAAEWRYGKERRLYACMLHLEQGRICSLLSLPFPPPHTRLQ